MAEKKLIQDNNILTSTYELRRRMGTVCVAADELGNWQDETNATKTSINYSTSGTVAVLKNDLDAYYNQSNAPGTINNPLEVEVNGVDGQYKFAYGLANVIDCASATYTSFI